VTQRNRGFVQMHNSPNRERYLGYIALHLPDRRDRFVRQSSLSLHLVCRTRLDRDLRARWRIRAG
jgi:hypothetical protein